ncbi:chromosome replication/partitioning protein [Borreliella burgdorferi]|uniref:Plasmid partition protein n=3 Tax=Borreliella burgdorferi TaxID=139 RepID=Q9S025_BORBU|nr:chromosome replication/partitioning protein [Borreliella burgdorferi]AAF07695.2 putative plasmid partition protein [Borreliella burgdorferi B31]EEC21398.1 putative plasmid partition protein [Borreliella burgdorferi 156a]MCD2320819.1 chromosome replication/partitioning protein [Borreliella burgdorferi]MCR8876457.1 chromosome replication/partitioning protein [Borreliella burgdorferi]MCR8876466.1 chromosome replication/partitioning protein [Borreliella burgdorferi]
MSKKNKKKLFLNDRIEHNIIDNLSNLDTNLDKNLMVYKDLKEQLKLNLSNEIDTKIQRMRILYEIKTRKLYKYDGFKSFSQYLKTFVVAKTQAFFYLKLYSKILEGSISIDTIKELGFENIKKHIFKKKSFDFNNNNKSKLDNKNISIRIFMRDKELYEFVKQDIKRASYIFKELFQNRKDVLTDIVTKYDNERN